MSGSWKHGLFEFSDMRTFALSWCCAPCTLGQDRAALAGRQNFMDEPVNDFVIPLFCGVCVAVMDRGLIREKYGIQGDLVNDIISVLLCGPCSVCQQTLELIDDNLPAKLFM